MIQQLYLQAVITAFIHVDDQLNIFVFFCKNIVFRINFHAAVKFGKRGKQQMENSGKTVCGFSGFIFDFQRYFSAGACKRIKISGQINNKFGTVQSKFFAPVFSVVGCKSGLNVIFFGFFRQKVEYAKQFLPVL